MKDTRSRILEAALTLFARHGYGETGMRLIAGEAGIRAPSIYKHFSSKEAILEALLERYGPGHMSGAILKAGDCNNPEEITNYLLGILLNMFGSDEDNRVMRVVMGEALRDEKIAALLNETLFVRECRNLERLFSTLRSKGIIGKQFDPRVLANECISKGFSRRYEVLIARDRKKTLARVKRDLRRQLEFFCAHICAG
jgi:AcrR family transcriptional regulator